MTVVEQTLQSAILRSAREELHRSGILGLRVAQVAAGANCSITNIYRFFGDRNGLLARILGDMYQEFTSSTISSFLGHFDERRDVTIDEVSEFLAGILAPSTEQMKLQTFRLQILAAATENPGLLERIRAITRERQRQWREAVESLQLRMAPDEDLDDAVFFVVLANFMPYYNLLLDEDGLGFHDFRKFFSSKLRRG